MRFFIRMSEIITGTILNQSVIHIHRRFAASLSRQVSSSRVEAADTPLGSAGGIAVMICCQHHWILHDDSWLFAFWLNWTAEMTETAFLFLRRRSNEPANREPIVGRFPPMTA